MKKLISHTLSLVALTALMTQCGARETEKNSHLQGAPFVQANDNPYAGREFFINPYFVGNLEKSKEKNPELSDKISAMQQQGGTAIWIVNRELVKLIDKYMNEAREQQAKSGQNVVTSFVVYNLPERDCSALASNGELSLDQDGMNKYKAEFIDPISEAFKRFPDMSISVVLEPDSLPNIVTNAGVRKCNERVFNAYREGVAYAIQKLALAHVALYLDTGHAGWLGWDQNRQGTAKIFREVLDLAGGPHLIRGFASNVSNYTPLREPDPSPERRQSPYFGYNPAMDELSFVELLQQNLQQVGIFGKKFIIDTGRSGNPRARTVWGNWCNIKQATLGQAPSIDPEPNIDAYVWIKPPGESDGSASFESPTQSKDISCASQDSMPDAPIAGEWYHEHLLQLLR
ncbi:MAG: glycoside hydrolase family 6 protein [Proteobacteria bacterium]|nr:glycoside hydrolase family 6 protein [Pseudomonadota bacterium]